MNVQPCGAHAPLGWEEMMTKSPWLCFDVGGADTSTSPGFRGHPGSLKGSGQTLAKKSGLSWVGAVQDGSLSQLRQQAEHRAGAGEAGDSRRRDQ